MRNVRKDFSQSNGFTLIEIVVSLIVISIAGAVLIRFAVAAIEQSSGPIYTFQQGLDLAAVMEKITADYKWLLLTDTTPLETFKKRVENGNDPSGSPYFGTYDRVTKYITFSRSDTEFHEDATACAVNCNALKITISRGDQHLTTLFTR